MIEKIFTTFRLAGLGLVTASFLLDPAQAGVFHATGTMNAARSDHTATLLPGGRVLAVGGYDTNGLASASAELYDPATGTWTWTGALHTARVSHTATLLPSGNVLVAGGYDTNDVEVASVELYDLVSGTWVVSSAMHSPRGGQTATLLPSGKILIAGGSVGGGSAELYDPVTGTWTETGALNESHRNHTATLLGDGKVLVAAGATYSAELYDPVTGTWTSTLELSDERDYHSATLLPNGQVLVVGGLACCGPFGGLYAVSSVELYNPTNGTWIWSAPSLVDPPFFGRGAQTATLLFNGRVLVTGGLVSLTGLGGNSITGSAKEYDPATGLWQPTGDMTMPRHSHTATLLANGQVLIAGGETISQGSSITSPDAELYDPAATSATGKWAMTGSMTAGRASHSATLLANGQVLVAGGDYYNGANWVSVASAELYDPVTETWAQTGALNTERSGQRAVLLPGGKVLVVGGFASTGVLTNSELYDPTAHSWSVVDGPPGLSQDLTATVLQNGRVLVAGGNSGVTAVSGAQLYDPVAGTWTETGAMTDARRRHTATLLLNGKVLVTGGVNSNNLILSSAELYDPASGTWTATGSMLFPRKGQTATLLSNGTVLVVTTDFDGPGGSAARSTGELYDPVSGMWTLTGSLLNGRAGSTATLLPNGQVLLAGGANYDALTGFSSIAELYDVATGSWKLTGALNAGTSSHTATLLPGGKVLVAGGYLGLQSAELYEPDAATFPTAKPTTLTDAKNLANGSFQFAFTNTPGAVFSVLATTTPTLPMNYWMVMGGVTEMSPGQFQFTDAQATNFAYRFYRLRPL